MTNQTNSMDAAAPLQFRKKPVVIEAVQISKRMDILSPQWLYEAILDNEVILHGMGKFTRDLPWVEVHTLEGVMRGDAGDWIIRGVKGEMYPCKPDIFEATYESATSSQAAPVVPSHLFGALCHARDMIKDLSMWQAANPRADRAAAVLPDLDAIIAANRPSPDAVQAAPAPEANNVVAYRWWKDKFGGGWEYAEPDNLPAGDWLQHRQCDALVLASSCKTALENFSDDVEASMCERCKGSGEQDYLSGGGPDAYDVTGPCSRCGGYGAVQREAPTPEFWEGVRSLAGHLRTGTANTPQLRHAASLLENMYLQASAPTADPARPSQPFTMYTMGAGYPERWIVRKDARGLIEPIDGPWRVSEEEARTALSTTKEPK